MSEFDLARVARSGLAHIVGTTPSGPDWGDIEIRAEERPDRWRGPVVALAVAAAAILLIGAVALLSPGGDAYPVATTMPQPEHPTEPVPLVHHDGVSAGPEEELAGALDSEGVCDYVFVDSARYAVAWPVGAEAVGLDGVRLGEEVAVHGDILEMDGWMVPALEPPSITPPVPDECVGEPGWAVTGFGQVGSAGPALGPIAVFVDDTAITQELLDKLVVAAQLQPGFESVEQWAPDQLEVEANRLLGDDPAAKSLIAADHTIVSDNVLVFHFSEDTNVLGFLFEVGTIDGVLAVGSARPTTSAVSRYDRTEVDTQSLQLRTWLWRWAYAQATHRAGTVTEEEAGYVMLLGLNTTGRRDVTLAQWRALANEACEQEAWYLDGAQPLLPSVPRYEGQDATTTGPDGLWMLMRIVQAACPEQIPWQVYGETAPIER